MISVIRCRKEPQGVPATLIFKDLALFGTVRTMWARTPRNIEYRKTIIGFARRSAILVEIGQRLEHLLCYNYKFYFALRYAITAGTTKKFS